MIAVIALLLTPPLGTPQAPEHLLRMRFEVGSNQKVHIESTHQVQGTKLSTLTMELRRKVLEVKGNRARIELLLDGISFGVEDPRSALFGRLVGAAWRGWIDDRGRFEVLTLVPPKGLPPMLRPLVKELERIMPARALPLPQHALRIGDDWKISAKDLAASPDGSWAKTAQGGLTCTLLSATATRAIIGLKLDSAVTDKRQLNGEGKMVIRLAGGWLESFALTSRLRMQTTIAGGATQRDVEQRYHLSSHAGASR